MHSGERFKCRNLFDFYKKSNKFRAAFHSDCVLEPGTGYASSGCRGGIITGLARYGIGAGGLVRGDSVVPRRWCVYPALPDAGCTLVGLQSDEVQRVPSWCVSILRFWVQDVHWRACTGRFGGSKKMVCLSCSSRCRMYIGGLARG